MHRNLNIDLGNDPAITLDGSRQPDRRQVSIRWLIGTLLTAITSMSLLSFALLATFEGRNQLATPPELLGYNELAKKIEKTENVKGERLIVLKPRKPLDDNRSIELSVVEKVGQNEIIRPQAFELINMSLAEQHDQIFDYPAFNALNLFDNVQPLTAQTNAAALTYRKPVDPDISIQANELPSNQSFKNIIGQLNDKFVEQKLLLSLNIDSKTSRPDQKINKSLDEKKQNLSIEENKTTEAKVIQENVSILTPSTNLDYYQNYAEYILPFSQKEKVISVLNRANFSGTNAEQIANAIGTMFDDKKLPAGTIMRLGIIIDKNNQRVIKRASIYQNKKHIISIAIDDNKNFVRCAEPEKTSSLIAALEGETPVNRVDNDNLPTVYDAIQRAALSNNLGEKAADQLVRILFNDIDMQSQISPSDSLEIFFPKLDPKNTNESLEILYIAATFNNVTKRYYRFQSKDGKITYYDQYGKNSKQFLLRKPVPNGIFRSPFGPRRHPILGYVRMHTGVDWAAPRGSPIVSAGDGKITKLNWVSGYGNHTEIQHTNGFVSSYSHQSAFAEGIKVGTTVHQGQIIGYVGTTGLSTGPHLHFEIIVNGTKVDPMRVRFPDENPLRGDELVAFKTTRDKINALIQANPQNNQVKAN